jgi:hypothetical protein
MVWDLRAAAGAGETGRGGGVLLVVPGKYTLRFKLGDSVETKTFEVRLDPRVVADGVTQADLQEQYDLLVRIQETSRDARATAMRVSQAISALPAGDGERRKKLLAIQEQLVTASGPYPQPMLIDQLSGLSRMAGSADMKVGRSAFEYFEELRERLASLQKQLDQ